MESAIPIEMMTTAVLKKELKARGLKVMGGRGRSEIIVWWGEYYRNTNQTWIYYG
jgi:hypothetical protein